MANESRLYVFSDAPRSRQSEQAVQEVRQYLKTIDGFAMVDIQEREKNFGLAASVIDGVSLLCKEHGRAIVIEDDLVVAPGFLRYLNAALERYQSEPRVMQIAGHMFPVNVAVKYDAFFLPFISSWGWATWDRAWRKFDPDAHGYAQLKSDAALRNSFDMDGAYHYFAMLEAQLAGKVDSWAIRWNLSVFMNDGMVLYPKQSLVENTGFDGSGVHCRGESLDQLLDSSFLPRRFPAAAIDPEARKAVFDYFRARHSPAARLRALTRRLLQ